MSRLLRLMGSTEMSGSADTPFITEPVRVTRAYEELASIIRQRIVSGELQPGDRLPAEAVLAREARVSRSTVREALRVLQEQGAVERASAKTLVVGAAHERASREFQRALLQHKVTFENLREALVVLEPQLTRLATLRAKQSDLDALEANLEAQAASLGSFDDWGRLDQEFHLAIAQLSGNPALVVARAPISDLVMPVLRQLVSSEALTGRALQFHRRMLDRMRAGDAEGAAVTTLEHVTDLQVEPEQARRLDRAIAAVQG